LVNIYTLKAAGRKQEFLIRYAVVSAYSLRTISEYENIK